MTEEESEILRRLRKAMNGPIFSGIICLSCAGAQVHPLPGPPGRMGLICPCTAYDYPEEAEHIELAECWIR